MAMISPAIEDHGTIKIWRCSCGFGMDAIHVEAVPTGEFEGADCWICPECNYIDYGIGVGPEPQQKKESW